MTEQKKPYFENLDALRFVAAFAVFVFHVSRDLLHFFESNAIFPSFKWVAKITDKGALGVNFFFVLSGFLITYLMFWEHENRGGFSYKKFLLRRTLRIWPLYLLIVLLGFIVFPWLIADYETAHQPLNYLLFLANFDEIKHGAFDSINFLTSPWSIAVEEQFYVVWGLVGLFFLRPMQNSKKVVRFFIFGLLVISLFFRIVNLEDARVLYYHTLSVMPDLLLGCLLAMLWYENPALFQKMRTWKSWQIVLIYISGLLCVFAKNIIFQRELIVLERYVIALFFAFVIADQIVHHRKIPLRMFHAVALKLGKISYGLYMYHLVVLYLVNKYWFSQLNLAGMSAVFCGLMALIYLVVSWLLVVLISVVSYRFFELPFLRIKERF